MEPLEPISPPDWLQRLLNASGVRWQAPTPEPVVAGIPDESEPLSQQSVSMRLCGVCRVLIPLGSELCEPCEEMLAEVVKRFTAPLPGTDGCITYEDMLNCAPMRKGDYRADVWAILHKLGW